METIQTILSYADEAFVVVGAFITFATVVVGITPTKKDDELLAKLVKLFEWASVIKSKK